MDRATCFLGGAAVGAVTTYFFDPDRGRARRAVCEAWWASRARRTARTLDKAGRDLAHRATGLVHEAEHLIHGETPSEDGHRGLSLDILHEHLAPGTRLFLGALGGGLFAWGLMEKAPEACVIGTIGALLALPAVTGRGAAGLSHIVPSATEARPSARMTERPAERVPVM
jgi:hypothetical protein